MTGCACRLAQRVRAFDLRAYGLLDPVVRGDVRTAVVRFQTDRVDALVRPAPHVTRSCSGLLSD
jgi:hypothetical protein